MQVTQMMNSESIDINFQEVQSLFFFCLQQNSVIEKAFLFDVVSKIYIATDSSPVDMQSYELCCDMIDVVIDVSCIYGWVVSVGPMDEFHWTLHTALLSISLIVYSW